jgi:hypothetical protein
MMMMTMMMTMMMMMMTTTMMMMMNTSIIIINLDHNANVVFFRYRCVCVAHHMRLCIMQQDIPRQVFEEASNHAHA